MERIRERLMECAQEPDRDREQNCVRDMDGSGGN